MGILKAHTKYTYTTHTHVHIHTRLYLNISMYSSNIITQNADLL